MSDPRPDGDDCYSPPANGLSATPCATALVTFITWLHPGSPGLTGQTGLEEAESRNGSGGRSTYDAIASMPPARGVRISTDSVDSWMGNVAVSGCGGAGTVGDNGRAGYGRSEEAFGRSRAGVIRRFWRSTV